MNIEEVLKIFGQNVQRQREKENMTLKQLSEKTGIREQYLKKIETGKAKCIRYSCIVQIEKALNTTASHLCDGL